MKTNYQPKSGILILVMSVFVTVSSGLAAQTPISLKGLTQADAIIDFRTGTPKKAKIFLGLVHSTYKGEILAPINKNPKFVVVFIGPAVKLISTNHKGFSAEEKKDLKDISKLITEMSKDGIRIEICLFAAKLFKVDPATILPEIEREENGVISLLGYQAKNYSLIPLY